MHDLLPDEVLARRDLLPRKPAPVVLTGRLVELRPLEIDAHAEALHAVSCGAPYVLGDRRVDAYDADALIWRWMRPGPHRDAAAMRDYLAREIAAPDALTMAALDRATGAPIGVASFMASSPRDLRIELGGIWVRPDRTGHRCIA